MTNTSTPTLKIHINGWSLLDEGDPATEAGLRTHLAAIKDAGFQGYCWAPSNPQLKELLAEYGLRYGGAFEAAKSEQFADRIAAIMAIDNGPINCQLADDDTPIEEAIELTLALMAEAKKQHARCIWKFTVTPAPRRPKKRPRSSKATKPPPAKIH
mgnify:CR=1 FL=1